MIRAAFFRLYSGSKKRFGRENLTCPPRRPFWPDLQSSGADQNLSDFRTSGYAELI